MTYIWTLHGLSRGLGDYQSIHSAVFLRIFYSRMFLYVEDWTWSGLNPRQNGEAVRRVWDWKKSLGSLIPPFSCTNSNPGAIFRVFILQVLSSGPHIVGIGTAPILSFIKAINVFNMQHPKINNSWRTIRGPNKEDMRVVKQGEALN